MSYESPADMQPGGTDGPGSCSRLLPTKTQHMEGPGQREAPTSPAQRATTGHSAITGHGTPAGTVTVRDHVQPPQHWLGPCTQSSWERGRPSSDAAGGHGMDTGPGRLQGLTPHTLQRHRNRVQWG